MLRLAAGPAPGPPETLTVPGATLDDAWQALPLGAYTTLRTFGGDRLLCPESHAVRLEESARLAGSSRTIDRVALRAALRTALDGRRDGETRVRLLLTYGTDHGWVYVGVDPLPAPDPAKHERGVCCVTCALARSNPRSKSSGFIPAARRARAELPPGIEEALMLGLSDELLEGLSSNFWGIAGGVVFTAEDGVLLGITRTLVLEQARALGLAVRLQPVRHDAVGALDEAFLTSSTRGVMPVVAIDGTPVGAGVPGPVTAQLRERYEAAARRIAERP